MRPILLLLAASAAMLLAGAASAQQGGAPPPMSNNPSAPLGSADNPIPQSSPTPSDQAFHLKAGDPNVVSNGPVPDTPQNRAAYGQPMSHTGKHTKPAGN
jgi:hypothetical protein